MSQFKAVEASVAPASNFTSDLRFGLPVLASAQSPPSETKVQYKRPIVPSAKRKHAALQASPSSNSNVENVLVKSDPVAHIEDKQAKKARLSIEGDSSPDFKSPSEPIVTSASYGSTRQESLSSVTAQLSRLKIGDEERQATQDHVVLAKSALVPGSQSGPIRKRLQDQIIEDRINQVRQIKETIATPAAADGEKKVHLPILMKTSQPDLNCISSETIADLLDGKYDDFYEEILIIDCRFDYEFDGGHIRDAVNFPDSFGLEEKIFDNVRYRSLGSRMCVVFHCEFSSHRGPRGYKKLRSLDRKANAEHYPQLDFPEMYLLEGGYKTFWECEDLREYCEPQGYVEMKAPEYSNQCKEALKPRCRSVSKTGRQRHFSMSCSNIFDAAAAEKTAGPVSRGLSFNEQDDEDALSPRFGSTTERHNLNFTTR